MKSSPLIKKSKPGVLDPWNRSRTLFPRASNGDLLSRSIPILGGIDDEMIMIPLTISAISKLKCDLIEDKLDLAKLEVEMVKQCLIFPKYNQYKILKPDMRERVKLTVLFECGFSIFHEEKKKHQSPLTEKKYLYQLFVNDENTAKQAVLLHELGYTFFNIPNLTNYEVDLLLQTNNKIQKKRNGK